MAGITINSVSISELLDNLENREWLAPKFQREFVWSVSQVKELVGSILSAYPIGMVTLWAQPDEGAMELEPLSVPDELPDGSDIRYFSSRDNDAKKKYAILDGRQRSTAIAMAFGGFKSQNGRFKFAGSYYLNVATQDEAERVQFIKDTDAKKQGLTSEASLISMGLFPLHSGQDDDLNGQWMRYLQAIRDPQYYEGGKLPDNEELTHRESILRQAFNGIINTKLAVYVVPERFNLGDICEIFETLNTTGTKVSTVDLIHSWLYSDTASDPEPMLLRDWIAELNEVTGAVGWADVQNRPELVAQIVTACYVASANKAEPRAVGGRSPTAPITSIKAGDLLATPAEHWRSTRENKEILARFIGDFQNVVADGGFPWRRCPYPASACIYIALRWHLHFDQPKGWGQDELNSLYRAFFWRNALTGRYDQGFLTQVGKDIKMFLAVLSRRTDFNSAAEWANYAQQVIVTNTDPGFPSFEELVNLLTNGRPGGALQKALHLLLFTKPKRDLLNPDFYLEFPDGQPSELHHIFPKAWCNNNIHGELREVLDPQIAGNDYVNSTSNLMLLSRESNNKWKARLPGQALREASLDYQSARGLWNSLFVDETLYEHLQKGAADIREFLDGRAKLIARELIDLSTVRL